MFGVTPAILKEKRDDPLEKFIRSTSPECSCGGGASRYKSPVSSRNRAEGVPLPIMRKICEQSFHLLFGHAK